MSEIGEKGVAAADADNDQESLLDCDPDDAKLVSETLKTLIHTFFIRLLQRKLCRK